MTPVQIRDAEPADLPTITEIHNHAVVHTTAIWNEDAVDVDDRAAWLADRTGRGYPVIVAADETGVVGYASYAQWRPHSGYRHTVEHSVYVRGDQRGRGIGTTVMTAIIERARASGIHVMIGGIESANTASIALHERLGFREVGRMPQVGAKFGRWLDLSMLQLTLDDRAAPPVLP
ncbi:MULTISPECIES: GNAT family N-acetyltransferase [unclassified Microbacterium]|uniref:GNAT family N-acetyltransferase n=1 Tax=unclassified Microbacterium TaxID=2609290 RepID=UPI000EAA8BF5|nr:MULTISPECIES: GNAT family N-acetyltransferase [unclassified Microbacterium]MBT2483957.1 N-acetyltransferase [Microbacterium sp. ISL-108]RKN66924.1 N-acetyltransferase family protein [Microbacterium sp. CGR2]